MEILTPISPSLGNLPGHFPFLLMVGRPCHSHRLQSPASHVRASATPPATFQRKTQLASSCQKFPQTVIPLKAWVQRWKLEQFRSTLHVDPGSHRGLVSRFPRWWGFQSNLGQPSMDCLGLPSTDLLFPSLVTQRGSEFVGKQVKEWEGLFAPLRRQATSALMVCLSLRTSWSFDAELSLISGLLSYFVWTAGGRRSRKKALAIIIPPLHLNLPTLTTLQAHSIPQMPAG